MFKAPITQIPPHTGQDYGWFEMTPFEWIVHESRLDSSGQSGGDYQTNYFLQQNPTIIKWPFSSKYLCNNFPIFNKKTSIYSDICRISDEQSIMHS